MKLAIFKEKQDSRVALVPEVVKKVKNLGLDILIEQDAGSQSGFTDELYSSHARVSDRSTLIREADVTLSIAPLSDEEHRQLKPQTITIAQYEPYNKPEQKAVLQEMGIRALSLDMIPRTTLAQSMDVLSSMASIAGYRAVLEAATHLPRYFPMMITAAGSIRPAKVLVLGAGVAGLQAIATARRLGAMVEAFDTRQAAREEVKSLGAKFIEVEGARDDTGAGGYAVQQSEEFIKRQQAEVQERASKSDVIITTAQVRGRKAPLLVPRATVDKMQTGSVIVDLAASTGGNCELTKDGEVVQYNGIRIIGDSNLAARMPEHASLLYSNNLYNFLNYIIKEGAIQLNLEDEIVSGAFFTAQAPIPKNDNA
jgi:NAD(P) transhydrogenase subunit alpha